MILEEGDEMVNSIAYMFREISVTQQPQPMEINKNQINTLKRIKATNG